MKAKIELDSTAEVKLLRIQKGDILVVVQREYGATYWPKALRDAGAAAGIDFSVPIVFVDDIDEIAVLRMGENAAIQQNG